MLSGMQVTCECWDGFQGLEALTNLTELILSVRQDLPEVPGPLRQLTQLQRLTLLETGEKESVHDLDEEVRSLAQVPIELAGLFSCALNFLQTNNTVTILSPAQLQLTGLSCLRFNI